MDNMTKISSHNEKDKFLNETNGKACNCRNNNNCPLDNQFLTNKIFYKTEVETNIGTNELSTRVYLGLSMTERKSRYNNHAMSFRNQTHTNDTKLSKYIWCIYSLKDKNKDFYIKWFIFKKFFSIEYCIKIVPTLPLGKASNMQFQIDRLILNKQLDIRSCVEVQT